MLQLTQRSLQIWQRLIRRAQHCYPVIRTIKSYSLAFAETQNAVVHGWASKQEIHLGVAMEIFLFSLV